VRAGAGDRGDDRDAGLLGGGELGVRLDRLAHGDYEAVDLGLDHRLDLLGVLGQAALGVEDLDVPALGPGGGSGGVGHPGMGLGRHLKGDDGELEGVRRRGAGDQAGGDDCSDEQFLHDETSPDPSFPRPQDRFTTAARRAQSRKILRFAQEDHRRALPSLRGESFIHPHTLNAAFLSVEAETATEAMMMIPSMMS
jgi:hypothetical protein